MKLGYTLYRLCFGFLLGFLFVLEDRMEDFYEQNNVRFLFVGLLQGGLLLFLFYVPGLLYLSVGFSRVRSSCVVYFHGIPTNCRADYCGRAESNRHLGFN